MRRPERPILFICHFILDRDSRRRNFYVINFCHYFIWNQQSPFAFFKVINLFLRDSTEFIHIYISNPFNRLDSAYDLAQEGILTQFALRKTEGVEQCRPHFANDRVPEIIRENRDSRLDREQEQFA